MSLHLNGLAAPQLPNAAFQPAYAYGWSVTTFAATGSPASFYDGTTGTFFCHTILFPSQQVAFVILTNDGDEPARLPCYALRRLKSLYLQGRL
jgi:hypothetical protein